MSFGAKEFKFKDPNAIDLGDDGDGKIEDPFGHFGAGSKPNKQAKKKDAATLRAEAQKRKEEEEAKLPTKGKPSDFFIMDYLMGDTQDLTGQCRVPTAEQRLFVFTHYPNCAQPSMMIAKIYELFFFAKTKEEKELAAQAAQAYKQGPRNRNNGQNDQNDIEDDLGEDSNFGVPQRKPAGNKPNKPGGVKPNQMPDKPGNKKPKPEPT